ncbi:GGDEF domain-containing protein [Pseudoroseicyclus aestuarii]|uniref:diguanylate cyclase n=1 Tax=Pseudoroseicyclus aestuarii TaxID=1795041 RepID=A0A318SW47_9RHOB|nr:GGDEF domain-containing protein [Pseudoroseicyclus aestuarii]PYE86151.1 diguanylate cyclase (GGDEF)-like protein [Pseudoroseicyclus aestuarii]
MPLPPGIALAIERLSPCLLVVDATGIVRAANAAARRAFDLAPGEPLPNPGSFAEKCRQVLRQGGQGLVRLPLGEGCLARAHHLRPLDPAAAEDAQEPAVPLLMLEIDRRLGASLGSHAAANRDELQSLRAEAARLRRLSEIDPMTGLLNGVVFAARAQALLEDLLQRGAAATMIYLDLNGFKQLNDTLGHDAGDAVIRATGQRLRLGTRDDDLVARVGGDEFCLLLPGVDAEAAGPLADRLGEAVHGPLEWQPPGGGSVAVLTPSAAAGLATAPEDGDSLAVLRRAAEAAMYAEKRARKLCRSG